MATPQIKAALFDVIGTVVDWRGTIIDAVSTLAGIANVTVDAPSLADDWAGFYARGAMFRSADDLASKGRELLVSYGLVANLTASQVGETSRLWTHLKPWPDSLAGLDRLRSRYAVAALTNCTLPVIVDLSLNVGLRWDVTLSAESAGAKKPDPRAYGYAAKTLGLVPGEILMVAAHLFDVRAARSLGFRTAYIRRREDRGPAADDRFDYVADDLVSLAEMLGC